MTTTFCIRRNRQATLVRAMTSYTPTELVFNVGSSERFQINLQDNFRPFTLSGLDRVTAAIVSRDLQETFYVKGTTPSEPGADWPNGLLSLLLDLTNLDPSPEDPDYPEDEEDLLSNRILGPQYLEIQASIRATGEHLTWRTGCEVLDSLLPPTPLPPLDATANWSNNVTTWDSTVLTWDQNA
jgi:hypothetical protein